MQRVIGLIPAAGKATRLSPLPVSKELYPIGFQRIGPEQKLCPKVVSQYLLESLQLAGVNTAYFILRAGKWDIPAYYGDGSMLRMHLGYLMIGLPYGVPYTLNQAYPFLANHLVALGFPDILFEPRDAFQQLLQRQSTTQAEVVLGVVPIGQPQHSGMVDVDAKGRVQCVLEKPGPQCHLRQSWFIAVWSPIFTEFMHQYLKTWAGSAELNSNQVQPKSELTIAAVIQAGIEAGLRVEAEIFPQGHYLDIGRPETLVTAIYQWGHPNLGSNPIDPKISLGLEEI